ncbi:UNVERIFIED_CONTAM: amidohydrolase, partial [Mumia flava]
MRPHRLPQCLLSALTLSLVLAGPARAAPAPEPVDILIRNGTVVDGRGGAPFVADVGIRHDRIVLVQPSAGGVQAKTVLDARGLVVAPGFIDPHTHAYHNLIAKDRHQNLPYLLQGVTTVVIGNDGIVLEGDGPDLDRIGPTLKALEANRIGTNVAMLVGHNAVRHRVMGDVARVPTAEELKAMQGVMEDGMRDGAFGMSTGLVYTPGVFAKTDEVVALAKTVAARGGIYDTHLRDEGNFRTGLVNAVKEALDIGQQSGIPIHISHIKALGV